MSDLQQCMECGVSGWNIHEIKDGKCPSCREYEAMAEEYYCFSCWALLPQECCCDEEYKRIFND